MATVKSTVRRVEVQGNVVLTLSPMEAIFLVSLLSETNGAPNDESDPESLSSSIFQALDAAGVPTSENMTARDGNIYFDDEAMDGIRDAMKQWE
jgi:hypothetical protein